MPNPKQFERYPYANEISRFNAKIDKVSSETGCWVWTGALAHGYGRFRFDNRTVQAHRLSWFIYTKVQPALDLDHLCRNTQCVNPSHLQDVPHKLNILRSDSVATKNYFKESCIRGHLFDEENTYITKSGKRQCRACSRLRDAQRIDARYTKQKTQYGSPDDYGHNPILSQQDINVIKQRVASGEAIRALAREYFVSPAAIRYHLKK